VNVNGELGNGEGGMVNGRGMGRGKWEAVSWGSVIARNEAQAE